MIIETTNTTGVRNSIVENITSMIINGQLSKQDILPSIRIMSQRYGVSRSTVVLAYKELESLGYIEGRERSCYVVLRSGMTGHSSNAPAQLTVDLPLSADDANLLTIAGRLSRHDNAMLPPHFIRKWCKDLSYVKDTYWSGREEHKNAAALKHNFVRYLKITRGIDARHENMLFMQGPQEALAAIAWYGKMRNPCPTVVLEDPCSPQIYQLFSALNYEIIFVRSGKDGLEAGSLPTHPVDFVCVSPTNHFPSGARMSMSNRAALLAWSRRYNALIIESDASFTFGFTQEAIPPLCTHYPAENVIYLHSLTELTGYSTSLSLVLAPTHLLHPLEEVKALLSSDAPWLGINMIGAFSGSPHLMKYLASTLQLRKEKYTLALDGLTQLIPRPDPWGLIHAGYFSFTAESGTEPLLNTFCYPLALFCRQQPQPGEPLRYVYPVGTLTVQEIEKMNTRLRQY
ncbi:GntR family transcriptional regulator [Erwinia oleae]|uniref:GntR family transcriptional regulator n=1 Tax=Erwinia oleae TaxID=796334 RepID=UPI0005522F6C|nr:PLP-dependent aminotransferase family protein [Erwinia oleae]